MLIVKNGVDNGRKIMVLDKISMGRHPEKNDVSFPEDKSISSVHCKLLIIDSNLFVIDNSTYGTNIIPSKDRKNIITIKDDEKFQLKNNDQILIGNTLLEVYDLDSITLPPEE